MARIVDSLKNFYKKQGGTPSDVRGIKSISGVIDKIANLTFGGGGTNEVIYSFEERKIGTAFGEDLYQKTFIIDRTDASTFVDKTVQFPEIKNFINTDIYLMDNNNPISTAANAIAKIKLNLYNTSALKSYYEIYEYPNESETPAEIQFYFGTTYSAGSYPYLCATIQYTKHTTD